MRSSVVVSSLALVLWLAVSTAAYGAPCAGFNDVSDASPFCPNVEWLKNRSITLGCTSTSTYCPDDPVTRLSMAAFMNRLGVALEPTFLYANGTNFGTNFAARQYLCPTTAITPTTRRWATVDGRFSFRPVGSLTIASTIYQSTDNGTTWTQANSFFLAAAADAGKDTIIAPMSSVIPLEPGTSYSFAISASNALGTSGNVTIWFCETRVRIDNRNGATSPFDH